MSISKFLTVKIKIGISFDFMEICQVKIMIMYATRVTK